MPAGIADRSGLVVLPGGRRGSASEEVRRLLESTAALVRRLQERVLSRGASGLPQCGVLLEQSHANLSRALALLNGEQPIRDEGLSALAERLQQELKCVAAMMEQAVQFYAEWIRILNLKSCGYTGEGVPARPAPQCRFSVES